MKSIFKIPKSILLSFVVIELCVASAFASSTNSLYDDFLAPVIANCDFEHGSDTIDIDLSNYNEWEAGRYVLHATCHHARKGKSGRDDVSETRTKVGNPNTVPATPSDDGKGCPDFRSGSIIMVDSRTVGEVLPIAGTNYNFIYLSNKVWGNNSKRKMIIPTADTNSLVTEIDVAGTYYDGIRSFSTTSDNTTPLQKYTFEWDGLDAPSGNKVYEPVPLEFTITYTVFGKTIPAHYSKIIGNRSIEDLKMGGWEPDILHYYDFQRGILDTADGTFNKAKAVAVSGGYRVVSPKGDEVYYFSSTGRHLRTTTTLTNVNKYVFNYSDDLLTSITDINGRDTIFNRDEDGYVTSIVAPGGQTTILTYDANKYLATITDAGGSVYAMTYYGTDGLMHTYTEPEGQVTTFTFDSDGLLSQDEHSGGFSTTLSQEVAETFHAIKRVNISYSSGITEKREMQNVFDSTNEYHSLSYNKDGTQRYHRSSDSNSGEYYMNYMTNRSLRQDPRFGDAYRFVGRESITNAAGFSVLTEYARSANLSSSSDPFSFATYIETTKKGQNVWQNSYDVGAKTWIYLTPEGRKTKEVIDDLERPISIQQGSLLPTFNKYDELSGKIKSVTQGERTNTINYDIYGYIAAMIDPLGGVTSYKRDGMGRILVETKPDGRKIAYTYDLNGNLKTVTPDGKGTHTFNYNGEQLLSEYVPPSAGSGVWKTQYAYDVDKNITQITKPDGNIIYFHRDATSHRIDQVGDGTDGDETYYSYDFDGNVNSTSYFGVNLNITYNGKQVASEIHSICCDLPYSALVEYGYDDHYRQNRIKLTDHSLGVQKVDLYYDKDDNLRRSGDMTIDRDDVGKVTNMKLDKSSVHYFYDKQYGELSKIEYQFNGKPKLTFEYKRDKLGRINYESNGNGFEQLLYDKSGRYIGRTKPFSTTPLSNYIYDGNGDRIRGYDNRRSFNATYDSQDRILSFNGKTYSYNQNGERYQKVDAGQTTTYTFNILGLMVNAVTDGKYIEYTVGDHDQRIGRRVNEDPRIRYIYKSSYQPLAELSDEGNLEKFFVYATDSNSPDYMIVDGNKYLFIKDARGSVVLVVDAQTGEEKQRITYSEWGEILDNSNPGFQPFGFAGGLYDNDTKLVHFGVRDYDPETGSWLSKDPIRFDGGDTDLYGYAGTVGKAHGMETNLYGYSFSDPVNFIDPTGLYSEDYFQNHMAPGKQIMFGIGLAATGVYFMNAGRLGLMSGNPYSQGLGLASFGLGAFLGYEGALNFDKGLQREFDGAQYTNSGVNMCSMTSKAGF